MENNKHEKNDQGDQTNDSLAYMKKPLNTLIILVLSLSSWSWKCIKNENETLKKHKIISNIGLYKWIILVQFFSFFILVYGKKTFKK